MDSIQQAREKVMLAVKMAGAYFRTGRTSTPRAALKAYVGRGEFKTQSAYQLHAWAYMREFFTGGVDAFGFIDLMAAEIDNQLTRAWHEGAAAVGVEQADMTEDDDRELADLITTEQNYLDGVAGDIEAFIAEGGHTDAEFGARFKARAAMWANGYASAVSDAKLWFGDKEKLEWVFGDTDHCTTCLALNGIVAWAREWDEVDVKPQGSMLECGGYNCQCQLVPTDKRRTARAMDKIIGIISG
jgi:hypothetical protein